MRHPTSDRRRSVGGYAAPLLAVLVTLSLIGSLLARLFSEKGKRPRAALDKWWKWG